MESAELIDSYPWKHWKSVDAVIDIENARVELVDIWHFLLSLAIERFDVPQALTVLSEAFNVSDKPLTTGLCELTTFEQVRVHEEMMRTALETGEVTGEYLAKLAASFFKSCWVAGLSFNELYQIYMAKNVLNKFRQDHGYKEGTYIKVWQGREDNVVMFELISRMNRFSGEALYEGLESAYRSL
ncbi:MAG: hypothetical protein GXO35_09410, partial [Gammaproteobacteria bacterium]|nr:hypothetical protein [Gammaproteobacteria bacterium]